MSQDSNSSEESLALSEGTMSELKGMVAPDLNRLDIPQIEHDYSQDTKFQVGSADYQAACLPADQTNQHQDYQSYNSQPSCSFVNVNASALHNNDQVSVLTPGYYYNTSGSVMPYTVQQDGIHRHQQILPKPTASQVSLPLQETFMPVLQTNIPLNKDFPGIFGFDIDFQPQKEPAPKASSWIHSKKIGKLFARRNVDVPILIVLKKPPDQEVYQYLSIRIVMVYSDIEHSKSVVQMCPNHASELENGCQHIMGSSNPGARYGRDIGTNQHVLTFPVRKLETGCCYTLEFVRFMCFNTCPGGPDRRPFHAVFTLLCGDQVFGVKILPTKICTTPGRSRDKDEATVIPKTPSSSSTSVEAVPKKKMKTSRRAISTATATTSNPEPGGSFSENQAVRGVMSENGTQIKQEEDDEIFTIQVRGRQTYETLMRVKEAIELMRFIPPDVLQQYRESCPPCGPNWFLQQIYQNCQSSSTSGSQQLPTTSHPPNARSSTSTASQSLNSNESTNSRYTLFMAKKTSSTRSTGPTNESDEVVK